MSLEAIKTWLADYPYAWEILLVIVVLLLSWLSLAVTKRYLIKGLTKLAARSKSDIDDLILQNVVANRLAYIAPILVIYYFANLLPELEPVLQPILLASIALIVLLSIGAFLNQLNTLLQRLPLFKDKPVKSYIQVVKLIIYVLGAIVLIGLLTGSPPLALLGSLGAMTAVLILVFRDTILSFVASIQITANDLVKVGDWIEARKYGADGDVIDIALHTVKIQNFDKTITVIPTHKLIDDTFKNWRGMQLSGGRRIKRALYIDQASIRFCDEKLIEKFRHFYLLQDYVERKLEEIEEYNKKLGVDDSITVNGRRMTNIGTFRAYIEAYLRNHDRINRNMTFLVRQLPPGPTGLPIEIYVFADTTAWIDYEAIQADIFDHLLAILPEFGLRVFQNPTGHDFAVLPRALNKSELS